MLKYRIFLNKKKMELEQQNINKCFITAYVQLFNNLEHLLRPGYRVFRVTFNEYIWTYPPPSWYQPACHSISNEPNVHKHHIVPTV